MSRRLPCPNPACSHVFDLGALAGAASVVCPRCGTRFQFRAKASAAPPLPVAVPVTTKADALAFPAEPSVVRVPSRRRSPAHRRGPLLAALVACAILVGLFVAGLVWYRSIFPVDSTSDEANLMPAESNCRFKMPDGPW